MKQLVNTMFISNNRPSFHLWWKGNLVKHRKASKYYKTDCRPIRMCRIQLPSSLFLFTTGYTLFRIFSLSWNLVTSLIRTCRIQWWWSFFLFLTGDTLLGEHLVQKFKIVCSMSKFIPRLILICGTQWWCAFHLF